MTRAPEPGLVIKLRPTGPWRIGPDSGERHDVDSVYHSDSLYSAITGAMSILGFLEDWLSATARNPEGPAVRFSSLFPFQNEIGFVIPPLTVILYFFAHGAMRQLIYCLFGHNILPQKPGSVPFGTNVFLLPLIISILIIIIYNL